MNNKSLKEFNKLLLNHFESIGASIIYLENQSASWIFYYQRNIISGSPGFKHHFLSFYPPSQYQAQRGLVNKELVILSGREVNILRDNKKETIGYFPRKWCCFMNEGALEHGKRTFVAIAAQLLAKKFLQVFVRFKFPLSTK